METEIEREWEWVSERWRKRERDGERGGREGGLFEKWSWLMVVLVLFYIFIIFLSVSLSFSLTDSLSLCVSISLSLSLFNMSFSLHQSIYLLWILFSISALKENIIMLKIMWIVLNKKYSLPSLLVLEMRFFSDIYWLPTISADGPDDWK